MNNVVETATPFLLSLIDESFLERYYYSISHIVLRLLYAVLPLFEFVLVIPYHSLICCGCIDTPLLSVQGWLQYWLCIVGYIFVMFVDSW